MHSVKSTVTRCPNVACRQRLRLPAQGRCLRVTCPSCGISFDFDPRESARPTSADELGVPNSANSESMSLVCHMVDVGHPKQTRAAFVANLVKERLDAFHATGRLTPLWLGVWGYDEDPRALFEIPEVRDWCAELYQEIQGLFAFLHPDTISWLFPCLAEVCAREKTGGTSQGTAGPDFVRPEGGASPKAPRQFPANFDQISPRN